MSPVTHFFISWLVANTAKLDKRDRILVTVAGILPDIDGIGVIADILTKNSAQSTRWYEGFHHIFAHNVLFALLITISVFMLATKRMVAAFLAFVGFHIHLLGDIAGSAGPEGSLWPIVYFWPFSEMEFTWSGQWELNAWQNIVITAMAIGITLFLAWKRGYSPLELFSQKADRYFVEVLRKRFRSTDK
jgi:hypothetical protein